MKLHFKILLVGVTIQTKNEKYMRNSAERKRYHSWAWLAQGCQEHCEPAQWSLMGNGGGPATSSPAPVTGTVTGVGLPIIHTDAEWEWDMHTYKSYNRASGTKGYARQSPEVTGSRIVFFLRFQQHLVHFCDSAIIHLGQSSKVHPE